MKSDQCNIGQGQYLFLSKIYTFINKTQDSRNQLDTLHLKYCQTGLLIILYLYSLFSKVKCQMYNSLPYKI